MRLIDADALKETLKGTIRYFDVVADIEAAPTIDPMKHGKWNDIDLIGYKAICSECGVWSPVMGNYCPNCGALMERSEE